MGLYTKLADDIDEVDVIIAGGEILHSSNDRDTNPSKAAPLPASWLDV